LQATARSIFLSYLCIISTNRCVQFAESEPKSRTATTPAWLMVPPIFTHGWLPLSLNLGLLRDHTARNPSSQDTDDELQTLLASFIALRLKKQVSGAIVSTHSDPPAGQPRPHVSAPLRPQVFHYHLRLHLPEPCFPVITSNSPQVSFDSKQ
jgi:hypothetical protein